MNDKAIILFTRVPEAGKAKTRLQPFLTGEKCVILQEAFIKDIFSVINACNADIVVCYTPENAVRRLKDIVGEGPFFLPQKGDDLGGKMHNAICDVLDMGYKQCLLMGSDIPTISVSDIDFSFNLLKYNDVVINPTEDGGYYLIGMSEPCKEIFNMEYGGRNVFENTKAAAKSLGKTFCIGPSAIDIDDKNDLMQLIDMLEDLANHKCANTRKVLQFIFDTISF